MMGRGWQIFDFQGDGGTHAPINQLPTTPLSPRICISMPPLLPLPLLLL